LLDERPSSFHYCVYGVGFHPTEEPISMKAAIAHIRSKMRRTDACSLQLRRKFRKRKIAWILKRPQFWFEHMVLRH